MCRRFTLTVDPADRQETFHGYTFPPQFAPRFNIAPTQPVLAIPNDGRNNADFFVWGLIPFWAKDPSIGSRLYNARGETLAEKPSFCGCYKYRRCLILTDGFYMWKSQPDSKVKAPHFICLKNRQPFAFAGLWDEWHSPDGSQLRTCAIITTEPNDQISPIHNRMPNILPSAAYAQWLDPAPRSPESLQSLIKPYPAGEMTAHPVSTLVNSPKNDRAECIMPV